MRVVRTAFAALVCLFASAAPRLALACSVCTAGREDEAQTAFLVTTVFLSVLPLSMFAGFGIWIWRRHRMRGRTPAPVREGATPPASLPELT